MRSLLTAVSAAALMAAPASAQDWTLDRAASSVMFEAYAFDAPLTGEFETFSAEIRLDPEDLSTARIDASVDTTSFALSNSQYRASLAGGDGLAVQSHPQARFVSENVRAVEDGYEAVGELTLKGETQALTLPFTLEIDEDRAVADGSFTLDRSDFGVGSGSWSDVGPSVTVTVNIEADRAE